AYRPRVVLPALLRDPARDPEQTARRDRDVLVDPPAVLRSLARHLAGALGQIPAGLQVVLLALHRVGRRAGISRLQAPRGFLCAVGAPLHRLLLPPPARGLADCRRARDAVAAAA